MYRWVLGENLIRFRAELALSPDPARRVWLEQCIQEHLEALQKLDSGKTED